VTARWVVDEVKDARDLNITWQPISLLFKNEPPEDSDFYAPVKRTHQMLRVMEAVREPEGENAVFGLYWEYGRRIHHDREFEFEMADALAAVGLPTKYAEAFEDDSWDAEIRKRMDVGLELAGDDIGTPILAFDDKYGVRQAYFGPVITRVPPTEDSLAMWDALCTMMDVQGFWELKRTRTERPEFGERP
jgi:hypothetical protein